MQRITFQMCLSKNVVYIKCILNVWFMYYSELHIYDKTGNGFCFTEIDRVGFNDIYCRAYSGLKRMRN
jgi:hypothetical protein